MFCKRPNPARHTNPTKRLPFDMFWKFERPVCAQTTPSGRVGALDRSAF